MIRLETIGLREIRLPLVEPFRSAGGVVAERRVLLLELADGDGATAWSECVAESLPAYSAETVDTCWLAMIEWLAPRVLGQAFDTPAAVDRALGAGIRGHRMARAAVEMGSWSLGATLAGQPLAKRLAAGVGGDAATPPRRFVATGIALGMRDSAAQLAERARAAHAEGYSRIKLKIAPGRDVDHVRAVREALGPDVQLTADGNSSYDLDDAAHRRALKALDAFGLAMIEQPLAYDDLRRHAELQRELATPICLDESIVHRASAADMIAMGSGRAVNLKPGRVGGLTESIAIHDLCASAGIALWCGGMLETGIGRAYNVALASLPGFTEAGDLSPSARYWAQDIVTPPWTMNERGLVAVPLESSGLGVTVDVDRIDALTVRAKVLQSRP